MKLFKLISVVVLLVVVLGAAACGGGGDTSTTAPPASETTAPPVTETTAPPATETTAPPATETTEASTDTTLGPGESVTLIWASGLQSQSPTYTEFITSWAKWVEAKTNGRLTFDFQIDGSVLPPPQILDGISTGVADVGDLFMGLFAGRFPLNEVVSLPFMFTYPASRTAGATATALINKYPELQAEFTKANVKFLGFMPMGAGQIHTTKKVVKTVADLKGMVLESHSGEYVAEALKILGATPEQINPAEGFDALAKGIVEGTIGEYEFIVSAGFGAVINHSTEVGTFGQGMEAVVMNLDSWNKLPADIQAFLAGEAFTAYTEVMGYFMDVSDKTARDKLDAQYKAAGNEGVYVLPAAELEAWKTAIAPVWAKWVENANKLGAPGDAILADAQAYAKEFAYGTYAADYPEGLMKAWGILK